MQGKRLLYIEVSEVYHGTLQTIFLKTHLTDLVKLSIVRMCITSITPTRYKHGTGKKMQTMEIKCAWTTGAQAEAVLFAGNHWMQTKEYGSPTGYFENDDGLFVPKLHLREGF
ncbi:hypothetical protein K7X08_002474 [Anisodus acutangulus]|uniref:Uncharacterized protein n=1 Tax=Anisodus acutangulus TaxID=402998 RepID=A0A9Q1LTK8_9SOLA|nr:hypothetical protein K7X08_002474 [Anisodus acutangulus]